VAVGVVLEQVDVAGDALARQPVLGVDDQVLQDALTGAVVVDELDEIVTFGSRVLRMRADIEVDPGSVAQEDVDYSAPRSRLAGKGSARLRPESAVACRQRCTRRRTPSQVRRFCGPLPSLRTASPSATFSHR
jgi:hypothetical protein